MGKLSLSVALAACLPICPSVRSPLLTHGCCLPDQELISVAPIKHHPMKAPGKLKSLFLQRCGILQHLKVLFISFLCCKNRWWTCPDLQFWDFYWVSSICCLIGNERQGNRGSGEDYRRRAKEERRRKKEVKETQMGVREEKGTGHSAFRAHNVLQRCVQKRR